MRPIGFLIGVSLALSAFSPPSVSSERDIEYKVLDGKLSVFGHVLNPKYPIPGDDYEGRVIAFHASPNSKRIVIQSGYRVEVDLWLYDTETKTRPIRIPSKPGNHTTVNWHGNSVFEVFWGGMGYSMSQLFRVAAPQNGKRIDDMLLYDEQWDVYVSFFTDDKAGIEVGRAFPERELKPEKIKLDLEYTYVSDARFTIDDVRIVGNKIVVTHTKANGEKVEEAFSSRFLRR
ncbi:MAG: hypothetical protein ACE5K1_07915 [Acidiferrobacterales bacterium]